MIKELIEELVYLVARSCAEEQERQANPIISLNVQRGLAVLPEEWKTNKSMETLLRALAREVPLYECDGRHESGKIDINDCKRPAMAGLYTGRGTETARVWLFCGVEHTHPSMKPIHELSWEMLGRPWRIGDRDPRFTHDCKKCVFLGQFEEYDFWWCKSPSSPKLDSVLARFSDRGQDYLSSHPPGCFAGPVPETGWYGEILRRAREKGLYDPEVSGWKEKGREQ